MFGNGTRGHNLAVDKYCVRRYKSVHAFETVMVQGAACLDGPAWMLLSAGKVQVATREPRFLCGVHTTAYVLEYLIRGKELRIQDKKCLMPFSLTCLLLDGTDICLARHEGTADVAQTWTAQHQHQHNQPCMRDAWTSRLDPVSHPVPALPGSPVDCVCKSCRTDQVKKADQTGSKEQLLGIRLGAASGGLKESEVPRCDSANPHSDSKQSHRSFCPVPR